MKLFTHDRIVWIFPICFFILASCQKDKKTAEEWSNLANAKFSEIQTLTNTIPCAQQDQVSIESIQMGCETQYFAVTPFSKDAFTKLKKDYLYYRGKAMNVQISEGIIIEPCPDILWTNAEPIRLDCHDAYVQIITAENLPLEEAQPLIDELYPQIVQFIEEQTCSDNQSLYYTMLLKDTYGDFDYIPYSRESLTDEIRATIATYNHLKFRLIEASGDTEYTPTHIAVSDIECVDGKPVIRFREPE